MRKLEVWHGAACLRATHRQAFGKGAQLRGEACLSEPACAGTHADRYARSQAEHFGERDFGGDNLDLAALAYPKACYGVQLRYGCKGLESLRWNYYSFFAGVAYRHVLFWC